MPPSDSGCKNLKLGIVDERNPTTIHYVVYSTTIHSAFSTSQVVQDFFHQRTRPKFSTLRRSSSKTPCGQCESSKMIWNDISWYEMIWKCVFAELMLACMKHTKQHHGIKWNIPPPWTCTSSRMADREGWIREAQTLSIVEGWQKITASDFWSSHMQSQWSTQTSIYIHNYMYNSNLGMWHGLNSC